MRVVGDDEHGDAALDQLLGHTAQQQPPGPAAVVMTADDQIERVLVGVPGQRTGRGVAVDDLVR